MIRKPIIVVLGHTDAGKTRLLDSIRGTAIAEKEAGGITQHIGATEIPISTVKKISGNLIEKYRFNISIPGLLFIDTPGHEAFTNLRKRGGSVADLAVLVVDINKGLEKQAVEAIEILKSYKTPFVVVANKIDTIRGFGVKHGESITESLALADKSSLLELDTKIYEIVGQLGTHGFNSDRFDMVKDFTKEIPIIPASAKHSMGIAEVILFLAGLSQKYLGKRLEISKNEKAKGSILEVKEEKGIGKTIDVILYEGKLSVGEEIAVGGKNGAIVTKVRGLFMPKTREKSGTVALESVNEVHAAAGVRISAQNLEGSVPGSTFLAFSKHAVKEIEEELKQVRIDSDASGVTIKADTLGSLEAIGRLLEQKGVRASHADIGAVSHRDIMRACAVAQKDRYSGVVFAFNVMFNEGAREEAEKLKVQVFDEKVIYKAIENYFEWVESQKRSQKKELLESAIPFRIQVLKNHIFRASKPAVVGVRVEAGKLRPHVDVLNNGKIIGKIKEIQSDGKNVHEASAGEEVAVSIEGGVAGKNFYEGDTLYSFVSKKQFELLEQFKKTLSEEETDLVNEVREILKAKVGLPKVPAVSTDANS